MATSANKDPLPLPNARAPSAAATREALAVNKEEALSAEQLTERLRLQSPRLVDTIVELAHSALASEDRREATLDGKATTLLGAVGLSLTAMFAVGGDILLGHPEYLAPLGAWGLYSSATFLALALLSASVSGWFAWGALRVRGDYKSLSETDVFNPAVLEEADSQDEDKGVAYYKRYIVGSLWQMYQKHFKVHEQKAATIRKGQNFYLVALALLLMLGLTLVGAAIERKL